MTRAAGTETLIEQAERLEVEAAARSWEPYPEYRATGLDWLERVPAHWRLQKLKHAARIQFSNVDKKSEDGEQPVRLCNYVDVYYRDRITSDIEFMEATALPREVAKFQLMPGDVLVTKDSEDPHDICVPAVVAEDLPGVLCGYHLAQIRPAPDNASGPYLSYALASSGIRDQFRMRANGITRFGLSQDDICSSLVCLPSLPEQRAIAAFLDRKTRQIDELIEKKHRLIELLQEKRTALISHAVTKGLNPDAPMKPSGIDWLDDVPADVLRLKFLSSFVTSGSRGWAEFYSDDGEVFLRIGNVARLSIDLDLSDIQRVTPPDGAEGQRTMVQGGDVLVSVTAYIGSIGVIPERFERSYVNQHLALVRPRRDRIEPRYLAYALFSAVGQVQFRQLMYGGTKEGLGLDDVKNLQVIVPSLVDQRAVVAHLDAMCEKLDKVSGAALHAIERLTEYRQAVISAAVTGKVDVRCESTTQECA